MQPSAFSARILVVDDEPLVRTTLAALLQAVGHTVLEAPDGPTAVAELAAAPVDLVLTDLGLPGMTGEEVAQAVKERHPGLPVVLLTGFVDRALRERRPHGPVDRVLGKPVRLADLLAVIADLCPAENVVPMTAPN